MATFKGVAYARYSSDKQQESSITVQLAEIRRFCEKHNIELIHEYVDEAQTGTNANRKDFQQMVRDAQKREFQFIIVHRMDRWARNVDDGRYYKKYFARLGIKMVSTIEEFDETPEGEFFELMSMGMAELYSKKLARESVAGKLANARECKVHGGMPLLGYRVQNKHYVIDEAEAEIVRIIFDLFLKGYGYVKIRKHLVTNGYKRSDGREFSAHFYDILRNRKYIGEYVYNRALEKDADGKRNNHRNKSAGEIIRIPGGMPRIIDDSTFFRVQEIMDERKHKRTSFATSKNYLLSGMIECGVCGKAICGNSREKCGGHSEYRCNGREKACSFKAIKAVYLEDYILNLLNNCLFRQENAENLSELIKICYIRTHEKLQRERDLIIERTAELEEMVESNYRKFDQDSMKSLRKYLEEQNAELRWEISELDHKMNLLEDRMMRFPAFKEKVIRKSVETYVERLKVSDMNLLRNELSDLIHHIVIDNETVRITLCLHRLLNGNEPILATIIEKRDNVAQLINHRKQNLVFASLVVSL